MMNAIITPNESNSDISDIATCGGEVGVTSKPKTSCHHRSVRP
jgi:hypothetical protein